MLGTLVVGSVSAQEDSEPTRLLEELNWLEARERLSSVQTVLLPVGTIEPHGVVNNGADVTVPYELALRLAPRVDALVAPTVPYGVTVTLDEYPGAHGVSTESFEAYVHDVMRGLAVMGFRNLVVVNGHGPNGEPLRRAAERVFRETDARILVTEWWSLTADIAQEVYGDAGGHAGSNETGAVLAVRPELVHPQRYAGDAMATARGEGWTAYPFPSSIVLYEAGEGYPDFDREKAARFLDGVVDRLAELITDVVTKWDRAGL
jgi:creatinine amidohydrolase